jgi:phosphohistidine phosphatase
MNTAPRLLMLMRHAKSSWADEGMDDFSRPLNGRGHRTAPTIAKWIVEKGFTPDTVLCSAAVRTQQTLAILTDVWNEHGEHHYDRHDCPELYLASTNAILDCVSKRCNTDPLPSKVMVIGHNPGLELTASMLSGQFISMATAECIVFEIDSKHQPDWALDLKLGGIAKIQQVAPKTL